MHVRSPRLPLLTAAVLCSTIASAQTAGWTPPKAIGTSSLYFMYANGVDVAVSAHPLAQSVAVWTEPSTMQVRYAVRRNGVWLGPRTLYTANANALETVTDPRVVIDATGRATALWGSTKQGPMKYCWNGNRPYRCPEIISYAKSATLLPGAARWSAPGLLSAKAFGIADVQVATAPSGDTVAAWVATPTRGAPAILQAAARLAGAGWLPAAAVPSGGSPRSPRLAINASGFARVLWLERSGTSALLATSTLATATGNWSASETVIETSTSPVEFSIGLDDSGRTGLTWNVGSEVWLARHDGSAWGIPQPLTGLGWGAQMAISRPGDILVSWLAPGAGPDGASLVEAVRINPAGTTVQAAWPTWTSMTPSVAITADGSSGYVVWHDDSEYSVQAARMLADHSWTATPDLLSQNAVWGMRVALAAGDAPGATVVWLSISGPNYQVAITTATHVP